MRSLFVFGSFWNLIALASNLAAALLFYLALDVSGIPAVRGWAIS